MAQPQAPPSSQRGTGASFPLPWQLCWPSSPETDFGRVLSSALLQGAVGRALLSSAGPSELASGLGRPYPTCSSPSCTRSLCPSTSTIRPPRGCQDRWQRSCGQQKQSCPRGTAQPNLCSWKNNQGQALASTPEPAPSLKPGVTSFPGFALKTKEQAGPWPTNHTRGEWWGQDKKLC